MATIPASVAVPAAIGVGAYLNARWRLPTDRNILLPLTLAKIRNARREKAQRINVFYFLEEHAQNPKIKDKTFLIYEGKKWTFEETYKLVLRYAGYLHSTHSVAQGEIVAMDFMNNEHFIFLTLAIWSLGATPAFINYNLSGQPLIHCIKVSTARLLLIDPEVAPKTFTPETMEALSSPNFRNNSLPLTTAIFDQNIQSSLAYFPPYRAPDSARGGVKARSPGVLIFTSGTTGLPKLAIVSWERFGVAGTYCAGWMGLRPVTSRHPDRYYTAMPLYHTSAFLLNFAVSLIGSITMVLGHRFSVSQFWSDVRRNDVTVVQYVGETLRYLVAAPPQPNESSNHKVRMAFGNGLRPDVWTKFKTRFNVPTIAEFYGATEGPSATWTISHNDFSTGAIGESGILLSLLTRSAQPIVKFDWSTEKPYRSPQTGFCVKASTNEVGEMLVKLDATDIKTTFQGYFNNDTASESKIMRDVFVKGDAYFRTGDVMRLDYENRLYFSDRIGDTFRWKSENVSTAEVSEALGHHPKVLEANVYGVEIPSHDGRAGCATLLLAQEPDAELMESLATYAGNSLPKYAVPLFLRVTREIQATGNNKQQKNVLRKEGVEPGKMGEDRVFWLRPGSGRYEEFGREQWEMLRGGKVKL